MEACFLPLTNIGECYILGRCAFRRRYLKLTDFGLLCLTNTRGRVRAERRSSGPVVYNSGSSRSIYYTSARACAAESRERNRDPFPGPSTTHENRVQPYHQLRIAPGVASKLPLTEFASCLETGPSRSCVYTIPPRSVKLLACIARYWQVSRGR